MCLIIYSPDNKPIPEASMRNGMNNNSDGAGIMWKKGERVFVSKGYKLIDKLLERVAALQTDKEITALAVHFRKGTSGGTVPALTHPFALPEHKAAIMHNGVISNYAARPTSYKGSDTTWFVYDVLAKLPVDWFESEEHTKVVSKETEGQRMLYFYPTRIIRTGDWLERFGVFYSNSGYEACSRSKFYSDDYDYCGNYYGRNHSVTSNPIVSTGLVRFKKNDKVWCDRHGLGTVEMDGPEFSVCFKKDACWIYHRYDQFGFKARGATEPDEKISLLKECKMNINWETEGVAFNVACQIGNKLEDVYGFEVTVQSSSPTTDKVWWKDAIQKEIEYAYTHR